VKAKLINDAFADITKRTEDQPPVKAITYCGKIDWVFPAGSEFSGPQAIFLVRCGMAIPSDEECEKAVDLSPAKLKELQLVRKMIDLGINDKDDQKLYRAGVILGYQPGSLAYVPGPNWAAYQQAQEQLKKEKEQDI
jgi:hypothetical protein